MTRRPFARERRPLPPRPSPYTPSAIRAVGISAIEAELFPRLLAEDVGRLTRGGRFCREMFATEAVGV